MIDNLCHEVTYHKHKEMNYKIIDKKSLNNDTVEIYTESNCNGNWFGLCQGTIIYVMARKPENLWYVKDIYAIE